MKNHFLIMCLAAALLVGCSKEPETLNDNSPVTHIIAKAAGDAEVSLDTKAPFDGSTFNGRTADIYTTTESLSFPIDSKTMFTNAYARGTMTFDATNYVSYNTTDFGGLNGGSKLLPTDGSNLYVYGFYPAGWVRIAGTSYESLTYAFDGHHDVMSTWLTAADNVKVAYMNPSVPEQADLTFKHLLTRFNIQIKAADAEALKIWGRVKAVSMRNGYNLVSFNSHDNTELNINYLSDNTKPAPSFFKLTGTTGTPTYSDDKFDATDYATAFVMTQSYQNTCYSLRDPLVSSGGSIETRLYITTITADGKEIATEVPVSLDPSKFTANGNTTRGFSITLALNFRMGVIQATAIVEPWRDYGMLYGDVVPGTGSDVAIGEVKGGGVVFWTDPNDAKTYKVVSVVEFSGAWSSSGHVVGPGAQSDTDGKMNDEAIKAYCKTIGDGHGLESNLHDYFPASGFCYSYQGVDGTDAKGTWYLPAKSELQYLWCAFNGKDPISWANGTNASASVDAQVQWKFNQYLINAGGTSMNSNSYCSSTEDSGNNSQHWSMYFRSAGAITSGSKTSGNSVRCIKTATRASFEVGDLKDGGIVYWIDPLDPSNYKVLSLKQPATTLTVCPRAVFMYCAQDGETDGRKNIAKMKTYSATDANASKNFAADYPAAHYCDTYDSDPVGTWYLPSKSELDEFSKIYAYNTFVLNQAIASNSGDAITTTTGSRYLTSSSESSSQSPLYVVDIAKNVTSTDSSHPVAGMVRCIRSSSTLVFPPAIGGLKDGGIVLWVDATDATKYKTVSLDEKSLQPSTNSALSPTDEVSDTGNENDGRIALAGLKKFATDKSVDYATTFPASAWCESKGAGWYLPALNELLEIYQIWNTNAAFKTAMGTKGTQFQTVKYGTATWASMAGCALATVNFASGSSDYVYMSDSPSVPVRCIKSTLPAPPAIGDLRDGGIVYEVTDATSYKIFSLTTGSSLKWSASNTYVLRTADGQDGSDGKKNTAAMKAYFAANTGTVGSDFSVAFPAAAFCDAMNTGGVTDWYLPASNELAGLYDTYKNYKAVLDAALVANSGTAMASGTFWSGTEAVFDDTPDADFVDFSNGNHTSIDKTTSNSVRCVRVK